MEVTEVPKQSSYLGGTCFAFTLRQSCGHVVLGTEIYAALGDVDSRTVQSFRCEDRLNLKPEGPQKTAGPPFHLIEGSKHNRNRKKRTGRNRKRRQTESTSGETCPILYGPSPKRLTAPPYLTSREWEVLNKYHLTLMCALIQTTCHIVTVAAMLKTPSP